MLKYKLTTHPRSLTLHGSYSYGVTLERSWIENNGLKAGDKIEQYTDESGNMVLVPVKKKESE